MKGKRTKSQRKEKYRAHSENTRNYKNSLEV